MRKEAEENGKPINVHARDKQTENCIEKYGTTPLQTLDRYGVLTWAVLPPIVSISPMRTSVAEKNAAVQLSYKQPYACQRYCRCEQVLNGVNVALGTDGASNNSLDMFEEMKLASSSKGISLDPTAISAYDALKMATVNGAKALRFNSGVIKEGCNADLAVLDFSRIGLTPCYDHVANVVYPPMEAMAMTVNMRKLCMNMADLLAA